MADVSITIAKQSTIGMNSTIMVSGHVDDAALAPFTDQLATLLAASVSSIDATSPTATA